MGVISMWLKKGNGIIIAFHIKLTYVNSIIKIDTNTATIMKKNVLKTLCIRLTHIYFFELLTLLECSPHGLLDAVGHIP